MAERLQGFPHHLIVPVVNNQGGTGILDNGSAIAEAQWSALGQTSTTLSSGKSKSGASLAGRRT